MQQSCMPLVLPYIIKVPRGDTPQDYKRYFNAEAGRQAPVQAFFILQYNICKQYTIYVRCFFQLLIEYPKRLQMPNDCLLDNTNGKHIVKVKSSYRQMEHKVDGR